MLLFKGGKNMKKMISFLLFFILIVALFIVVIPIENVKGYSDTLYVGGPGAGNYTTIQEAIDNAEDADTIFVYDDSSPYYENIVVDKSIVLIGEDKDTTIIDGSGENKTISVNSDDVTINGFTINNDEMFSVWISGDLNFIAGNNITSINGYGIYIGPYSRNQIYDNFIISNSGIGIYLWRSNDNLIFNNYLDNSINAQVIDGNNNWNGTKEWILNIVKGPYKGGNYWSDYDGVDTDDDGIGETPYIIVDDEQDELPLVKPGEDNNPPFQPSNPNPSDGSVDVENDVILSWIGGDPDFDDNVSYEVFFGTTTSPPKVSSRQYNTVYDPGLLTISTKYYWRIVAWDDYDESTSGSTWSFSTNYPPYVPSNPNPGNYAEKVSINTKLSWDGGDPSGDSVKYDIYFGTNNPPPLIERNHSDIIYDIGETEYETTYYWKIVAWDSFGLKSESDIWMFSTIGRFPIDPFWIVIIIICIIFLITIILKYPDWPGGKPVKPEKPDVEPEKPEVEGDEPDKSDEEEKDKDKDEDKEKKAIYLISAVKYDKKHSNIVEVKTHEYKDKKIGDPYNEDRKTVIRNINDKKIYRTTLGKNPFDGESVRIIKIKNKEYLRTDNNETEDDNLENLPEF